MEGGPFTFVLTEGRTASDRIVISNPDGHAELTFEILFEQDGRDAGFQHAGAVVPARRSMRPSTARRHTIAGPPVAVET